MTISLHDPVFATYVIAATIMILKGVAMSGLTVARMMQEKGGYRSPEDIRRTPLNPDPDPSQLAPNERVERIRRIQLNDLENLPYSWSPASSTRSPRRRCGWRRCCFTATRCHGSPTSPPISPPRPTTCAPRCGRSGR